MRSAIIAVISVITALADMLLLDGAVQDATAYCGFCYLTREMSQPLPLSNSSTLK